MYKLLQQIFYFINKLQAKKMLWFTLSIIKYNVYNYILRVRSQFYEYSDSDDGMKY